MAKKNIKESLNGNTFASGRDTFSSELISVNKVEGTPFDIVTVQGDGDIEEDEHFIAVGNHRLTKPTPWKDELLEKIENRDWELINTLMFATINAVRTYENMTDTMAGEGQQETEN